MTETKPTTTLKTRSTLNSAAAGYVAGVTGVVLGHPLDSAKVWIQTNSGGMNKHMSSMTGNSAALANTATTSNSSSSKTSTFSPGSVGGSKRPMSTHAPTSSPPTHPQPRTVTRPISKSVSTTLRALYSGVSGPLVTVGIIQSINFASYDAMRRYLHQKDQPNAIEGDYINNDSLLNVATAGFVAGVGLSFVTSPLLQIKTRQQITGETFRQALDGWFVVEQKQPPRIKTSSSSLSSSSHRSITRTMLRSVAVNPSRFCVGFYPHLFSETVGRALYYTVYEGCKRSIINFKNSNNGCGDNDASITIQDRMVSAAIAGISCWAVIFPFDALRNRLYDQQVKLSSSSPSSSTTTTTPKTTFQMTIDMIRTMHAEGSFFRGFGLTVLRAGPVAAAVMPVYDIVLETLSS